LSAAEALARLPGVDTASLTPKQRSDLVDLAGDTFCPCGGVTVAECVRPGGPACPAARRLLELAKKLLGNGVPAGSALLIVERYYGSFAKDQRVKVAADGPSKGPEDARIQIVEFSDFQCPACRAAHPALTELVRKYPADVRWVFRNFPLPQHAHAEAAAMAGVWAFDQGKFWPVADYFFGHQDDLGEIAFRDAAKVADLDASALLAASTDATFQSRVEADKSDGLALKVNSTPTLFINGRMLALSATLEYLSWTVEDELTWIANDRKWTPR
jgi:protein-disulfide isomerase